MLLQIKSPFIHSNDSLSFVFVFFCPWDEKEQNVKTEKKYNQIVHNSK